MQFFKANSKVINNNQLDKFRIFKLNPRVGDIEITDGTIEKLFKLSKISRLSDEGLLKSKSTMDVIKSIKKELKIKEDTRIKPKEAYILVSCRPCVHRLKEISKREPFEFEKTNEILYKIEKYLFRRNIYRKQMIKIATAVYLAHPTYSQDWVCNELLDNYGSCSVNSLQKLLKILGIKVKKRGKPDLLGKKEARNKWYRDFIDRRTGLEFHKWFETVWKKEVII